MLNVIAAIDVGSNTVLLQVARVGRNGRILTLFTAQHTPRLSASISATGKISSESVDRLVDAMRDFKLRCDEYGVKKLSCYGTSAMREARNSRDVIDRVKAATGVTIKVISGRKEAGLTYAGATGGLSRLAPDRVLLDVGGGSSEMVVGKGEKIVTVRSFKIGAVKLTEELRTDLKLTSASLAGAHDLIRERVRKFGLPCAPLGSVLICSGGTPTTLAGYGKRLTVYDARRVHGLTFRTVEIRDIVTDLATQSQRARARSLAFDPRRADVITAGGLLMLAFAEHYRFDRVRISDRSLRYGQLRELIGDRVEFA